MNKWSFSCLGNILIVLLVVSFLLSNNATGQPFPASDPNNNNCWILNEHLSDEFNGNELDKSKWWILGENGDYRHKWKGRAPGQFAAHNVKVENGELILVSQWEPSFNFANEIHGESGIYYGGTTESADNSYPITQACIMSESFFKYGYMEVRAKVADAPVTSDFWTTGYHGEIDMFENFGKLPIGNPNNQNTDLEKKYRTNLINWDPDISKNHEHWKVEDIMNVRLASDYFVYGFEWDKDYIKTYFNGQLVRHATRADLEAKDQWRFDYPHELWLDAEVFYWYGLPSQADLSSPAEYKIDYVRIWQKSVNGPAWNALGFEGPFYFQGRSVPWWAPSTSAWRIKDENPASGQMSLRFQHTGPLSGDHPIFAPFGSSDLPAGTNQISFKVWLGSGTSINKLDIVLYNPWLIVPVDLSNIETEKWVEVSAPFSRPLASDLSITSGDRLQITIKPANVNSESVLLFVDDITFQNSNSPVVDNQPIYDNCVNTSLGFDTGVDFNIYPNPSSNVLTIDSETVGELAVYTISSSVVMSKKKETRITELDFSHLPRGIYVIKLTSDRMQMTTKVLIE